MKLTRLYRVTVKGKNRKACEELFRTIESSHMSINSMRCITDIKKLNETNYQTK